MLVHLALKIHKIWEDLQKFNHENLLSKQNGMNHKNFRQWNFEGMCMVIKLTMIKLHNITFNITN